MLFFFSHLYISPLISKLRWGSGKCFFEFIRYSVFVFAPLLLFSILDNRSYPHGEEIWPASPLVVVRALFLKLDCCCFIAGGVAK